MAKSRFTLVRLALTATAGAVLIGACDVSTVVPGVGGPAAGPAPAPTLAAETTTQQSRPTVEVMRGTITEAIKVIGRVVSSQEADLYFKATNRLRGIYTETGQQVKSGDVLAELETGDLQTRIAQQKAAVENAQLKLEQVRAQAVAEDASAEQAAVQQAQINLDQARLALEKLQSGTGEADIKSAEASLIQARANVEKSRGDVTTKEAELAAKRAELEYRLAGPPPAELAKAQADVEAARIKLEQASNPPRKEDVETAELRLEQARNQLAQLRDAPPVPPEQIANAELAVRQAEVALERTRAEASGTPAQREAAVRQAELALDKARNDLSQLQNQAPTPWEIRQAELDVAAAETALAKLTSPLPYDAEAARVAHDLAVARLNLLQQGPSEQDLATLRNEIGALELAVESARAAIPSAEAALGAAQASYDARLQGATEFDLREAQLRIDKSANDLEIARAKLSAKQASISQGQTSTQFEIQSAQKEVEKQQLEMQRLEAALNDARIVAPFDGKITKVNGKPGDNVQAYTPVISISSPAQLLVQAQVNEADIPKLAVGQRALVTLDAFPGEVLNGTVRDLPSSVVTQQGVVADKNTKIAVEWTRPGAEIGMLSRIQIIVQKKDNVLVIPSNAIRTVGRRRFVEYMDGNVKRSRNVEVGISTDVDSEIVSGLEDGMIILAGT